VFLNAFLTVLCGQLASFVARFFAIFCLMRKFVYQWIDIRPKINSRLITSMSSFGFTLIRNNDDVIIFESNEQRGQSRPFREYWLGEFVTSPSPFDAPSTRPANINKSIVVAKTRLMVLRCC